VTDTIDEKEELRRRIRDLRQTLPSDKKFRASFAIAERFMDHPLSEKKTIGLYYPLGDKGEVDARMIYGMLRKRSDETRIAFPRVTGDRCTYHLVDGLYRIKPGKWGVGEPEIGCELMVPEVIVIPGIAFDRHGTRVGFGHGFFDRTIKALKPRPIVVGLAYDLQVVRAIQRELWDEPVDHLITETEFITMKESN
jgi:5-formyltetrahydrofolate cyclo-ligase